MTDEPIDFAAAKERREGAEIDADEVRWNHVNAHLVDVMVTSGLSDIGLTSAVLRALIDVLIGYGVDLDDAKQNIVRTTKVFLDTTKGGTR